MVKNKAFTLIEIIVVLAIMAIIFSFSLASYNNFTASKKLEADTKKIISILELAREKAKSEDNSFCTNKTDYILSYKVQIINSDTYILTSTCKTQRQENSPSQTKEYKLQKNQFTADSIGKTFEFLADTGELNGECKCIRIRSGYLNKTSDYICVNSYGVIETKKTGC